MVEAIFIALMVVVIIFFGIGAWSLGGVIADYEVEPRPGHNICERCNGSGRVFGALAAYGIPSTCPECGGLGED